MLNCHSEYELAYRLAELENQKKKKTIDQQRDEITKLKQAVENQKSLTKVAMELTDSDAQARRIKADCQRRELGQVRAEANRLRERLASLDDLSNRLAIPEECLEDYGLPFRGVNPLREVQDIRRKLKVLSKMGGV